MTRKGGKKANIRCNRPTSPLVNSSHLPLALAIAVVCSKHCDSYSISFDFRSFNLEIDSAVSAFWSSSAFLLVSHLSPSSPVLAPVSSLLFFSHRLDSLGCSLQLDPASSHPSWEVEHRHLSSNRLTAINETLTYLVSSAVALQSQSSP
jgi:hypothetical protein